MSEQVEDGGALEDWPPVEQKHRTGASRVQQAFGRILRGLSDRLRMLDPQEDIIDGELIDPWEPPGDNWD